MALTGGILWRALAAIVLLGGAALLLWALQRRRPVQEAGWLGHVEDLRRRLIASAAILFTSTAFLFSFDWRPGSAYPVPALHHNLAARIFHVIRDDLVPDNVQLVVSRPMDGFAAEMAIAFGAAAILTSPLWIWQLGGFVWPALRPSEQRTVLRAFVPVTLLFLAGAAFAYFLVLPFLLQTLYDFGDALGAQGLLPVSEFVTFTLGLMLVMGLAFQTPLVMWLLTSVGLVPATFWQKYWRHAILVMFILSAFVTDPTVVSQVMVATPLALLYGVGILLARRAAARRADAAQ